MDRIRSGSMQLNGRPFRSAISPRSHERRIRLSSGRSQAAGPDDADERSGERLHERHRPLCTRQVSSVREQELSAVTNPSAGWRLKAPRLSAAVSSFSGGNQQKVLLAKYLLATPTSSSSTTRRAASTWAPSRTSTASSAISPPRERASSWSAPNFPNFCTAATASWCCARAVYGLLRCCRSHAGEDHDGGHRAR